ncbi:hypothetical protein Y1Q_0019490 [Alligator mississippiensis]|uniref:Uncharacterized protein n=1 Tax=Alligator mississippiensis TaxID=8496 RepID=A0A151NNH7_ALLMI|nr:hypothetical protein Y1Q_0019490 [Alligator mississippiensis]
MMRGWGNKETECKLLLLPGLVPVCERYALWKAKNLLTNRHLDHTVKDCIEIGLTEMYQYYRKTEENDGKEMADFIWKRGDWHRLFRGKPSKENNKKDSGVDSDGDNDNNEYDDDE